MSRIKKSKELFNSERDKIEQYLIEKGYSIDRKFGHKIIHKIGKFKSIAPTTINGHKDNKNIIVRIEPYETTYFSDISRFLYKAEDTQKRFPEQYKFFLVVNSIDMRACDIANKMGVDVYHIDNFLKHELDYLCAK